MSILRSVETSVTAKVSAVQSHPLSIQVTVRSDDIYAPVTNVVEAIRGEEVVDGAPG
jgi:hypothetical protein